METANLHELTTTTFPTNNNPQPPAMPIAPTLAPAAATRPWLMKLLKPLAGWYSNAAGYRQMGLL